jgi:hypothetical protein
LQQTTWADASPEYEWRRLEAFQLAVDGCDDALIELTLGWSDLAPPAALYLADVHYLAGDNEAALIAIDLNRGLGAFAQEALVLDCVRRDPRLWRAAARIAVRTGSNRRVLRVLRVRLSRL